MWNDKWCMMLAAACVSLAALTPVFGAEPTGDPIKIGSLNSMTGLNSTFGKSTDKGIRLAAEERNKAGGVLGRPVEIDTADTESSADKTPLAVLKLIEQDHVVAVLGEVASSCSMAAAPECQRAKVPQLSPSSTNPKVTKLGTYIFRSCFTDDFQGTTISKFTAEDLKLKKAAILTDTKSDYSTGLTSVLEKDFPSRGGQIVDKETYQAGDSSFKAQLANVKNANPDIVFLPGYYTEIVQIVRQAREIGLNCPFIGGDGWDSDTTLKDGGTAVEGCFFTNHYDVNDPDPMIQGFVKKFKDRYDGQQPDAMAVTGYDAANIMFDAIERAKSTDGPALREAIASTKNFPAITGKISIGKDRNAIKRAALMKIHDGKFVLVKYFNP